MLLRGDEGGEWEEWQEIVVITMLEQGMTVPFIVRYRQDEIGHLDDTMVQKIKDRWHSQHALTHAKQRASQLVSKSSSGAKSVQNDLVLQRIDACHDVGEVEEVVEQWKEDKKNAKLAIPSSHRRRLEPLAEMIFGGNVRNAADFAALIRQRKQTKGGGGGGGGGERKRKTREDEGGAAAATGGGGEGGGEVDWEQFVADMMGRDELALPGLNNRNNNNDDGEDDDDSGDKTAPTASEVARWLPRMLTDFWRHDSRLYLASADFLFEHGVLATKGKRPKTEIKPAWKASAKTHANKSYDVRHVPSHVVLALNRGESLGLLEISLDVAKSMLDEVVTSCVARRMSSSTDSVDKLFVMNVRAANEAVKIFIRPCIEKYIRRRLTEEAHGKAADVFAKNLRSILMSPGVTGERIVGVDPGFSHGCKVAAISEEGEVLGTSIFYVEKPIEAKKALTDFALTHRATTFAVGNGMGHREALAIVEPVVAQINGRCQLVSECGASVYSVSDVGRAELPEMQILHRGAVSIARRYQNPLNEYTKLDCSSVGVGMYQKDLPQELLSSQAHAVLENCVSLRGADINVAQRHVLQHVAGLPTPAVEEIIAYRTQHGAFPTRLSLLSLPSMDSDVFERVGGFLKVGGGEEPLDETIIHPSQYDAAHLLMKNLGILPAAFRDKTQRRRVLDVLSQIDAGQIGSHLELEMKEVLFVVNALKEFFSDHEIIANNESAAKLVSQNGLTKLSQLKPGKSYIGTVTNVTSFGAFVDFGIGQNGLASTNNMRGPPLKVGDVQEFQVLMVAKNKIALAYPPREDIAKREEQKAEMEKQRRAAMRVMKKNESAAAAAAAAAGGGGSQTKPTKEVVTHPAKKSKVSNDNNYNNNNRQSNSSTNRIPTSHAPIKIEQRDNVTTTTTSNIVGPATPNTLSLPPFFSIAPRPSFPSSPPFAPPHPPPFSTLHSPLSGLGHHPLQHQVAAPPPFSTFLANNNNNIPIRRF